MCGINGIIYKNNKPILSEIQKMNESIKHRGPDDEGIFRFENVLLGHRRLSILDLSKKGKQPMSSDGRYWITYNGEIYNFLEIKDQLLQLGHTFYSNTDTEVILNAYKEWGVESFTKFNGMWSFAILDTQKKQVVISRDRYGIKPCYYYLDDKKFIFSSEIKGIFCSDTKVELNKNKIFINVKQLEGAFTTIYNNIDIVPPGFFFTFNLQNFTIQKNRWWNGLNNLPDININQKKIQESLKELLIDSTQKRLVSDVKIATSLSGGVDSSIIFSILNNLEKKNENTIIDLNPFIVKYKNNKTFDIALELCSFFNKKPIIAEYDEESIDNFAEKLSSIELIDPYFSQFELYRAQNKQGFKVSIDGHGADECLGGYIKDIQNFGLYFQNSIVDLYQTITNLKNKDFLEKITKQLNLLQNVYGFKIDLKNNFLNKFEHNEYIESKKIDLLPPSLKDDLIELDNFNFPLQVLYLSANYGHLQWLLNKWDKASMAHSVEIRSPFMDWRFFQYALALPAELKIKDGQNKSILRETFKNMLIPSVLEKKIKQGLPVVDFQRSNQNINFINEVINQNDFLESNIWDGKKIVTDFNNTEIRSKKLSQMWKIVRTHLMTKGFIQKKERLKINNNIKESFNKLN